MGSSLEFFLNTTKAEDRHGIAIFFFFFNYVWLLPASIATPGFCDQ